MTHAFGNVTSYFVDSRGVLNMTLPGLTFVDFYRLKQICC